MNEQWKRYAELELREREFEIALKSIQQEKAALEPELLDSMAEEGLDRLTLSGITFFPKRRVFAGPREGFAKQDVARALIESGLSEYVKEDYNANSLSSYVRGLAAEDDPDMAPVDIAARMPEPLRAVCSVGEVWQIGARKG